jgi:hypothetical protein
MALFLSDLIAVHASRYLELSLHDANAEDNKAMAYEQ